MTLERSDGYIEEAGLCMSCKEVYAVVIGHSPSVDWQHDFIEVLIEDRVYQVHRTDSCDSIIEHPYFNVRVIEDAE
jgi:hypothetical protein